MPRTFKLAILRARHTTTFATISDAACRTFLIEAPDRSAVLQYWADATMNNLSFVDTWMFPWVDITADPAVDGQASRGHLAAAAKAATEALGHDLSGYHGFLVLTPPGTRTITRPDGSTAVVGFDAGASNFGDGRRFCVVHTTSSHTFDAHELGHVVGYGHTHGLSNNGVDWAGTGAVSSEYGSPYDIMSAMSFGSKWAAAPTWSAGPTFARNDMATAVPGWPAPESWQAMGPLPARAHVYLHDAQGLVDAGQLRTSTLDASQAMASCVLWSAGRLEAKRTALLVVRDERTSPAREYCIEYRGLDGWDRGLDGDGNDVARRAVVVHSIEGEGAGRHAFYRGRIVVPVELDADLTLEGTDLDVRVLGVDATSGSVNVSVGPIASRRVMIDHEHRTEEHVIATEMREVRIPHCGDETLPWNRTITRAELTASLRAFGFAGKGAPEVAAAQARWVVGGTTLESPGVGTITVLARDGRTIDLDYELGARAERLVVRSRFDASRFEIDVRASVREADGSHETWSPTLVLLNEGTLDGFGPALGRAILRCLPHAPRELRLFPGCTPPEWFRPIRFEVPRPQLGPDIPGIPGGPGEPGDRRDVIGRPGRPGGLQPSEPLERERLDRERLEHVDPAAARELLRELVRPTVRIR